MKISTKGRYAVRLMYDLAMHHTGDWIALKDISRRQEISVKYLEQIVRQLSIRGYLKSLRGPKGGYQLSRDPKDYTIYEILKITEGSLQPVACLDDKVNQCERYHECPTIEIWEGLGQVIEEYLSGITLEDVVNKARIKGGRSDITDFEEIVSMDVEYIKNWSLKRDIKIILKTIQVVLHSDGAR